MRDKATGRPVIPPRNAAKNDLVMTPGHLAAQIIEHFQPFGKVLDPCSGEDAFVKPLFQCPDVTQIQATEITKGHDFFSYDGENDWIISNPPYSILTSWLKHSFTVADNVVYLIQATAPFFTARRNAAKAAGFGIMEMYYVSCPPEWKARKLDFGTGLAAVHWRRGWKGGITETDARQP